MFDLTDDVENSPNTTRKVKPTEVKPILKTPQEQPPVKKVNDDYNEYDVAEEDTVDDRNW